jgi:hypothetical protein
MGLMAMIPGTNAYNRDAALADELFKNESVEVST